MKQSLQLSLWPQVFLFHYDTLDGIGKFCYDGIWHNEYIFIRR